ncbi:hypothetical protein O6P43_003296 [Quillaja saponaria]|uniref:Uncharacterized protein n=1 Tax=Quillaja saponaria TaxID=32244 RepID=A0AAD7VL50_QUISA|nr:hypothetical protein O6P43_003296 [Quillaja saponaria]
MASETRSPPKYQSPTTVEPNLPSLTDENIKTQVLATPDFAAPEAKAKNNPGPSHLKRWRSRPILLWNPSVEPSVEQPVEPPVTTGAVNNLLGPNKGGRKNNKLRTG